MKVKFDFVTNSSSCSFIITKHNMHQILYHLYKTSCIKLDKEWWLYEGSKILKLLEEKPDFNENFIFPWTINYETFVYHDWLGKIRVDTCNNNTWWKHYDSNIEIDKFLDLDQEYDYDENLCFIDLHDMKIKTRKQFMKESYQQLRGIK